MPMLLLGGLHVEIARRWSMEEKAAVERQLNRLGLGLCAYVVIGRPSRRDG